jgi:hypothetical protein
MELFNQIFGTGSDGSITAPQMAARAVLIAIYAIFLLRVSARRTLGKETAMDFVAAVIVVPPDRTLTAMRTAADAGRRHHLVVHSLIAAVPSIAVVFAASQAAPAAHQAGKEELAPEPTRPDGRGDIEEELRLMGPRRRDVRPPIWNATGPASATQAHRARRPLASFRRPRQDIQRAMIEKLQHRRRPDG